jgi:hypothetical protein
MLERPSLRAKAPVPSPMIMALRSTCAYSLMCTVPWFTVFVITVVQISCHVPVFEEKSRSTKFCVLKVCNSKKATHTKSGTS